MDIFFQLLIAGVSAGSVYGLVALGFAMLVNTVNLMNFAQGEFVMMGAFVAYTCAEAGLPYWICLPLAVLATAAFGIVLERIAVRPIRRADPATYLVSTLAASVLLRNVAQHIFGTVPVSYTAPFDGRFVHWGGLAINPQDLLILAVTLALMIGLYFFLFHSRRGRQMRATAQDRLAAQVVGIRVSGVATLTFILAGGIGALAGVLVAPTYFISFNMGFVVGLKGFIATILGGWGSIPGALIGGIIVGLTETLAAAYVSSVYKDAFAFAVLVIWLLVMPKGLFGERVQQKA